MRSTSSGHVRILTRSEAAPDRPGTRRADEQTVLTMMVTNAVLGGIADTVAQTITSVRQRAVRKPGGPSRNDPVAIEIHDLDRKNPLSDRDLIPDSWELPPPFDFERLTRFMAYGFLMAPVQFRWFKFLEKTFPITKTSAFGPAMKRVAFDQLIFAPFGMAPATVVETLITDDKLTTMQVLPASSLP